MKMKYLAALFSLALFFPNKALAKEKNAESPKKIKGRILLVHGIFDRGKVFKSMQKKLEAEGYECYAPDLFPNDARKGLPDLAQKLKDLVEERWGTKQNIHIVGFSMGGIVSKYYLQNLGGADRCKHFFTISSPHRGTWLAYFYPSQGVKQLRPKSEFLKDLDDNIERLSKVQCTAYWTPFDLIILPARHSKWKGIREKKIFALLHPLMLHNRTLREDLLNQLDPKRVEQREAKNLNLSVVY